MIYLPLKHLRPNMVLAREVCLGDSPFPLLATGLQLTTNLIDRLESLHIPGVYIESKLGGDLQPQEILPPALKQKTLGDVKRICEDYTAQKYIKSSTLRNAVDLAKELVYHILSKEDFLVNVIDIKDYDNYTFTHSMYVALLGSFIGMRLGFTEEKLIALTTSGLLHDIGKLDVPLEIVNKPGALSPEEFELMKQHPQLAADRLSPMNVVSPAVLSGILTHHERFDGTGYPRGLRGKEIPEFGRILALADVYDALTSQRSYRRAWLPNEAIEFMMGCADTHFDYELLQTFLRTVSAYPVGTMVALNNGFTAVVSENSPENCLRPKVVLALPQEYSGKELDLANDRNCLNLTIVGVVDDKTSLPPELFE